MNNLVERVVRENVRNLLPYQPGKPLAELERELGITGAIKLASNENPLGPSPMAVAAAQEAVAQAHLYPEATAYYLRERVSDIHNCDPGQLVFGSGCNEVIGMLIASLCVPGQDQVLSHKYAFISYRVQTLAHGCEYVEAEVTDELGCDVDALLAKVTERTKLIFVANPNNPTGAHLSRPQLERLLEKVPPTTVVVIDEAYHEFASVSDQAYPSSQDYAKDRALLVTLRTFSKIHGLAGFRIGYGICPQELAGYLNRMRRPFNTNAIGQAAACAALDDSVHVDASAKLAKEGIELFRTLSNDCNAVVYPSLGNFVLVDVKRPCLEVYDELLKDGVIVRPMAGWGLVTHLRVSVGTEEQNLRAMKALRSALA